MMSSIPPSEVILYTLEYHMFGCDKLESNKCYWKASDVNYIHLASNNFKDKKKNRFTTLARLLPQNKPTQHVNFNNNFCCISWSLTCFLYSQYAKEIWMKFGFQCWIYQVLFIKDQILEYTTTVFVHDRTVGYYVHWCWSRRTTVQCRCGFKHWFVFCQSHSSDICNMMAYQIDS